MDKYIIGVSAYYHDSSACLFKDGEMVFACEEERFSKIKHDSSFPTNVVNYIFSNYKLSKEDIECVCYYENPQLKLERVIKNSKENFFKNPMYSISSYFKMKRRITDISNKLSDISKKVFYSEHHLSHSYYSILTSPFKDTDCLTIDGVGESKSTVFSDGLMNQKIISEYPDSLGLFYSTMTSFLGFKPNSGEYKVMGLSSYGNPDKYYDKLSKTINFSNYFNKIDCTMWYFTWDKSDKIMFSQRLCKLLELEPRLPEEELTQDHKDLAASIQKLYEDVLMDMLNHNKSDSGNLCLGGGCAYNGLANGKITKRTKYKNIWIPPAPSDAGSSIGACMNYLIKRGVRKTNYEIQIDPGPGYNHQIDELMLGYTHKKYQRMGNLIKYVTKRLQEGDVVGWYQGSSEFGARALGHRSILANPKLPYMKELINELIKNREHFRPFAPMVTQESQHEYFEMENDIPFMNQVVNVKEEYRELLPAITHVDGTARVQTVYKDNPTYKLLKNFEKEEGIPILLNTSFNTRGETVVLTPEDAIRTFFKTEIDILVINNYIIYK